MVQVHARELTQDMSSYQPDRLLAKYVPMENSQAAAIAM